MTTDLKMKKPILLNGKGRSKSLEVTIGEVKLELWDFEKPEGKPKVRLFVMADERTDVGDQDEETTDSYMDLEAMQTDALAMAIDRWVQSFESSMPDNSAPSMRLRIGALSLVFTGPDPKRTGHVQLTLIGRRQQTCHGEIDSCRNQCSRCAVEFTDPRRTTGWRAIANRLRKSCSTDGPFVKH
jgi:hypothetical protein